ncbi:MAG TPA: hypothetical protein VEL76_26700 [Gemmataceae bacterium]|nr:hypothetical protein [Gemmataceae bacterium]
MDTDSIPPTADRPCPLAFIVTPAFVGGLVWLCAMLARMSP